MQKNTLLFHVEGIRCHSCVQKIETALSHNDEIDSATVRMDNSLLEVMCDSSVEPLRIQQSLRQIGFATKHIAKKSDQYLAQKKQNRTFLNKIAVAGFCAGNIMLFSVSIYGGADKEYLKYFSWISALLFLPILFYSATDFYKNAIASLKNKYLSIDLPITIALVGGFLFSIVNLFIGKYEFLYFDSTASFIFLILVVRFSLNKIQQSLFVTSDALRLDEGKEYLVDGVIKKITQLNVGDIIQIEKNDTVPVDCTLEDNCAELNTSLLTGESYPKIFQKGMTISSGSLNVSSVIFVKALRSYEDSYFNQLLAKIEDVRKAKGEAVKIADKASHYLVLTVFSAAFIYFLFSFLGDPIEGFQRSLALIIVACPCALALGTPLAYSLGIKKARKLGMLIKNQNVFDNILDVKNLFFDKTGTLTSGKISLLETKPAKLDPDVIQLILNLEKISYHPIAYAIREKWGKSFKASNLTAHVEQAGRGVSAVFNGDSYSLSRSEDADDFIKVILLKNKELICELYFEDEMKPDISFFLSSIKNRFKNVFLISGDNSSLVKVVGRVCGIDENNIHSNMGPSEKYDLVKANHPAMMVGDGINDALSLKEALVGVAVHGAVEGSLESSDVYFLRSDLNLIPQLILLSKNVRKTLISNLRLSFLYNLLAGIMALTGFINPLVAAILMPISSIAIILNTYWRLK